MAAKAFISGIALALAASAVSGCAGGADGKESPTRAATPQGPASASTSATAEAVTVAYKMVDPRIAPEALRRWGKGAASQATTAAMRFSMDHSFDDELMRADWREHVDAALSIADDMTPVAARDWTRAVRLYNKSARGRERADLVTALTLYAAWYPKPGKTVEVTLRPTGPATTNLRFRSVATSLASDGRPEVDIKTSGDIRLVEKGKPILLRLDRTQTYWMVRTADGWKVDGWTSGWKAGQYRPDR